MTSPSASRTVTVEAVSERTREEKEGDSAPDGVSDGGAEQAERKGRRTTAVKGAIFLKILFILHLTLQ